MNNNNISIFKHKLFGDTRFITEGDSFVVVAKDVCANLGYASLHNLPTLLAAVPEIWKGHRPIVTPGGTQNMLCLSEQGLYFFLGRSDKPAALKYQMWIAGEVVPQIRKTGGYIPVKPGETDIEIMCKAFQILQATVESQKVQIAEAAPKVDTYDRFLAEGEDDIPMSVLANRLCQEGLPFGGDREDRKGLNENSG